MPYQSPQPDLRGEEPGLPSFRGLGWLALLVLFIAGLTMCLLLSPFDFQAKKVTSFLEENSFSQIHKINLALNLILFLPLGVVSAWAWKVLLPKRSAMIVLLVAFDAAVLSLIGEYLQMWLPERTSSLLDLAANIFGSGVGGIIGLAVFDHFTQRWHALAQWLSTHQRGRRAFIVCVVVLLARTAPFDASLETYYLRTKYLYETKPAGPPFSATKRWLLGDISAGRAATIRRDDALKELTRAGINLALFTVLAFAVTRALHEHRAKGGRHASAILAIVFCLLLGAATEALQLPIRSRLMDMTDPVAGGVGVLLGALAAQLRPTLQAENIRTAAGRGRR